MVDLPPAGLCHQVGRGGNSRFVTFRILSPGKGGEVMVGLSPAGFSNQVKEGRYW